MKIRLLKILTSSVRACLVALLGFQISVKAQNIVPDSSLGEESSTLNSNNGILTIDGGAVRGGNLFHSFERFGVGLGEQINISSPNKVENIITRVTGSDLSSIFGTLNVSGSSNLFLLNPNGIIFGENAVVNVGGAFTASTADRIIFEGDSVFSARIGDGVEPILSWNAPIGLQIRPNSGGISFQGSGSNVIFTFQGGIGRDFEFINPQINLNAGKEIFLVGNGISFNGADVFLSSNVSSIVSASDGEFLLNDLPFEIENSTFANLAEVSLDNISSLEFRSSNNIREFNLFASSLTVNNASAIQSSDIASSLSESGTINILATDNISVIGASEGEVLSNNTFRGVSVISSQNINIETKDLLLDLGGGIGSTISGNANGIFNISASDSITISGIVPNIAEGISVISFVTNEQSQATINLTTQDLLIDDGASILTLNFDAQASSDIFIFADTVQLVGLSDATGLSILPITSINNTAVESGQSGLIQIHARELSVFDGAAISTIALINATAGEIVLEVEDSITVSGFANEEFVPGRGVGFSTINSVVVPLVPGVFNTINFDENDIFTGNSGSVSITTNQLNLLNLGEIAVGNLGSGNSGVVAINANNLNINNGKIDAIALSGNGGNITIDSSNFQINGGNVSASSGNNGGNITINTDTLLSLGDGDITATAFAGQGGNISIVSDGVLGFESSRAIENDGVSSIDASSEFGIDGQVVINSPDIFNRDPSLDVSVLEFAGVNTKLISSCEKNIRAGNKPLLSDRRAAEWKETPDDYLDVATENIDQALEETVWKPGKPLEKGEVLIETEEGRIFYLSRSQLKNLEQQNCFYNKAFN